MDRDGRWNRGGGHARVSGDCSHWLENQSETGRNVTGIRWAGRERGEGSWPMSINGSPSPPLSPVHNNFDSRIIIAFLKQVSPKKIYYPGTTISNRFFLRIGESFVFFLSQLRPLLLYFLFFFSISFNCEILFFFSLSFSSPRFHHFISSFCGFNAWLHFSSFLATIFSISNPPFPPQFPFFRCSPIEALYILVQSPVKGFYPFWTAFIYLPSLLPSPSFPFSHTFEKTRNRTNLQPPKKLTYASNAIRKNPVWRARSSIQKGNGYLLVEPSKTLSFRKFISPSRITRPDRNQIGRPILARDPKLFRFDWQVGQVGDRAASIKAAGVDSVSRADYFDRRAKCQSGSREIDWETCDVCNEEALEEDETKNCG